MRRYMVTAKIVVTGITFLLPTPDFFYPGSDVHFHTIPLLKERMLQHFLRARAVFGVLDQAVRNAMKGGA
jgi:hypothetical protein